jgi:hypothetical protein
MSCKPLGLEKLIDEAPICEVLAGTSAVFSATVKFRVWGFHPLLRVMVYVYFQLKIPSNDSTSTWTARGIKRDQKGRQVTMQPIFSARSLEDGHEVNSGAEGIEYTCSIGNMQTSTPAGTWMAAVVAMPNEPMVPELFVDLCQRLRLDADKVVPQITASFP